MRAREFVTTLILLVLILASSGSAQEKLQTAELNEATYSMIRQAIRLQPSEAWEQIPWQPNLGEAVREARQQDKPTLLWMMNGHPAGMT